MSQRRYSKEEAAFLIALEEKYDDADGTHVRFDDVDAYNFAVKVDKIEIYEKLVASGDIAFHTDGKISVIKIPERTTE
jgi:hypothetical protein